MSKETYVTVAAAGPKPPQLTPQPIPQPHPPEPSTVLVYDTHNPLYTHNPYCTHTHTSTRDRTHVTHHSPPSPFCIPLRPELGDQESAEEEEADEEAGGG